MMITMMGSGGGGDDDDDDQMMMITDQMMGVKSCHLSIIVCRELPSQLV
jgi:hypothetical protein